MGEGLGCGWGARCLFGHSDRACLARPNNGKGAHQEDNKRRARTQGMATGWVLVGSRVYGRQLVTTRSQAGWTSGPRIAAQRGAGATGQPLPAARRRCCSRCRACSSSTRVHCSTSRRSCSCCARTADSQARAWASTSADTMPVSKLAGGGTSGSSCNASWLAAGGAAVAAVAGGLQMAGCCRGAAATADCCCFCCMRAAGAAGVCRAWGR